MLNYSNRFYKRQFFTRKAVHNDLLQRLESLLDDWFINEKSLTTGIHTVQHLAEELNISPSYLSDMLRIDTGPWNAQHVDRLEEKIEGKFFSMEQ